MRFNIGDPAIVVGGAEHRPEDIGKSVEVVGWFQPGEVIRWPNYESDTNDTGEACWAVILYDEEADAPAIAMKRDAWLVPLFGGKEFDANKHRELVNED